MTIQQQRLREELRKNPLRNYEAEIVKCAYGSGAKMMLFADKSPAGLIEANCREKDRGHFGPILSAFKMFAV